MTDLRFETARAREREWRKLADDRRAESTRDRLSQAALSLAAPLYGAGAWAHRTLYRTGLRRTQRVDTPVICVGNLTLGGAGKTPVVAWLARTLRAAGYRPAVVSRGYGGRAERFRSIEAVLVSDGTTLEFSPEIVGDEPVELAAVTGAPVAIGRRRWAAARLAERRFNPDVILLDDGFQHYGLERDCNLVVIDASRPPWSLRRFPRGSLREGVGALRRADAVVFTRCDMAGRDEWKSLLVRIRKRFPHLALASTVMRPEGVATLEGDVRWLAPALAGKRAFLFCGVGNPESVRRSVEALGVEVVDAEILPDHARASPEEIAGFRVRAREKQADFLLCTTKDAVKIPAELRDHADCPLLVVSMSIEFAPAEAGNLFFSRIMKLALRRRRSPARR